LLKNAFPSCQRLAAAEAGADFASTCGIAKSDALIRIVCFSANWRAVLIIGIYGTTEVVPFPSEVDAAQIFQIGKE
jgi:hypothetical protein